MKILIVDDDKVDRKLLIRAIKESGLVVEKIVEVTSVADGLKAIDDTLFDVVLLDYNMPQEDGIEMLLEMRAKPKLGNTAIVMISTTEDSDIALACIEAGAQDFLLKVDIDKSTLNKSILYAKKRFEAEQRMHESYLQVKYMAERDQLTGLSNRYHFEDLLKVMLGNNQRTKSYVALLAIDLDNFKHINDTLGHNVGDAVLKETVSRIDSCLRQGEGFARLGGDEFAIIIGGLRSVTEAALVANRVLNQFSQPFNIQENIINCTVSIGSAIYPNDATESHELLKCADIAMYRSKQNGKNKISFYRDKYQQEFIRKVNIQNCIKDCLVNETFCIHYQPQFCTKTDLIDGFEALIRLPNNEPRYTPDEFIPIAEECRLIEPLGKWIISTSIKQLAKWNKLHGLKLNLSINISPIQLLKGNLLGFLIKTVTNENIHPESITLEVTETAFIEDSKKVAKILNELALAGFKIALDDFGMGYSSISHLISYPINTVKLDKSIQPTKNQDDKLKKIIEVLVLMLKALGFNIVAEGVETESQYKLCKLLEVDQVQGFLLSKPLEVKDVDKLLNKNFKQSLT